MFKTTKFFSKSKKFSWIYYENYECLICQVDSLFKSYLLEGLEISKLNSRMISSVLEYIIIEFEFGTSWDPFLYELDIIIF